MRVAVCVSVVDSRGWESFSRGVWTSGDITDASETRSNRPFLFEINMKNTNEAFINDVIPSDLLETVINWIKENLKPGDVFKEFELFDWCKANCTDAAEVCPCDLLHDWAMDHDYVREE